jgi:hypothetical protein
MYQDSSDPNDPPREKKVELHIDGLIADLVSQHSNVSLVNKEILTREFAAFPSWPSFVESKTTATPPINSFFGW